MAAHRRDWVLWFSLDREYDALLADLLPAHTDAFESGKPLDPHEAW